MIAVNLLLTVTRQRSDRFCRDIWTGTNESNERWGVFLWRLLARRVWTEGCRPYQVSFSVMSDLYESLTAKSSLPMPALPASLCTVMFIIPTPHTTHLTPPHTSYHLHQTHRGQTTQTGSLVRVISHTGEADTIMNITLSDRLERTNRSVISRFCWLVVATRMGHGPS